MKNNIANMLVHAKGRVVSGQAIARTCGISRAAVWKHIQALRKKGYSITGRPHGGYVLLDQGFDARGVSASMPGFDVRYYTSLDSTQKQGKIFAIQGLPHKTLIIAGQQSAGYGRMQRPWASPRGGLWFSLVLRPVLQPSLAGPLTIIMAMAVAQILAHEAKAGVYIKWPNDVMIHNKKICGIVTEMQSEIDAIAWMVMGVGVNINNKISADLSKIAIDLKSIIGKQSDPAKILCLIVDAFFKKYDIVTTKGFKPFVAEFDRYNWLNSKQVSVAIGRDTLSGIVQGIDSHGGLILKLSAHVYKTIYTGEIKNI
jgi:BirA family biotin operon repressor/biotin-[acetyl-CoA-carboxylase] ligase